MAALALPSTAGAAQCAAQDGVTAMPWNAAQDGATAMPSTAGAAQFAAQDGDGAAQHDDDAAWAARLDAVASEYRANGCVFPIALFAGADLDELDALCTALVDGRPPELAPEDLLNLHLTVPEVLAACRLPRMLALARRLLGADDVSVFTSRILCKMPHTGKEICWHQDSNYWPLVPPGSTDVSPEVASVWVALDDVTERNGPMDVLPYSAQPESRGRNVDELVVDAGGSTAGFDNFNLSVDAAKLNVSGTRKVLLRRGDAEAHSARTGVRRRYVRRKRGPRPRRGRSTGRTRTGAAGGASRSSCATCPRARACGRACGAPSTRPIRSSPSAARARRPPSRGQTRLATRPASATRPLKSKHNTQIKVRR